MLDPRFPWLRGLYTFDRARGGQVIDLRTGEQASVFGAAELHAFIATHSAAPGRGGLGDAVRAFTKFLGFGDCTPCAKRQAALNARAPRLFRR